MQVILDPEQAVLDTDVTYWAVKYPEDNTVVFYGSGLVDEAIVQQVVKGAIADDQIAQVVRIRLVVDPS